MARGGSGAAEQPHFFKLAEYRKRRQNWDYFLGLWCTEIWSCVFLYCLSVSVNRLVVMTASDMT